MFQQCKLVHEDFSEYNLLYFEGIIYVIDVSQSVEMGHPRALEFLRLDIANTNAFFKRKDLDVMSLVQAFRFVVSKDFGCEDESMDFDFDRIWNDMITSKEQQTFESSVEADMGERVFMKSFIPTSLSQVVDIEKESLRIAKNQDRQLSHIMTGMDVVPSKEAAGKLDERAGAELLNDCDIVREGDETRRRRRERGR